MFKLRYKLIIVLVLSTLVTLVAHFSMTKLMFEGDRTSVIFDSLFEQTQSRAKRIDYHLSHYFSLTKALLISRQEIRSNEAYLYLLRLAPNILKAWYIKSNPSGTPSVVSFSGENVDPDLMKNISDQFVSLNFAQMQGRGLYALNEQDIYLAWQQIEEKNSNSNSFLVMAIKWPELNQWLESETGLQFILSNLNFESIWNSPMSQSLGASILQELKSKHAEALTNYPDITIEFSQNETQYVLATSQVSQADSFLVAIADRNVFFKPIKDLQINSILFLVCVIALFMIASILIAQKLTAKIESLTQASEAVGQGDLNVQVSAIGNDEIAHLSGTFNKMVSQIRDLIAQTAAKARMEQELKTAKTVQDILFPEAKTTQGRIHLAGLYQSASECGGDWWYRFSKGQHLFVLQCDATGHGVPAALMTSAARAAISTVEFGGVTDLVQIAQILSRSLFDTSKAQMMMTGFLFKIDCQSGFVEFINCSHENPVVIKKNSDTPLFLDQPLSRRLGEESEQTFKLGSFQLEPADRIFVYTDGLFAIENQDKKVIGERRGLKKVLTLLKANQDLEEGLAQVHKWTEEYRGSEGLPDDVTIVAFEFR